MAAPDGGSSVAILPAPARSGNPIHPPRAPFRRPRRAAILTAPGTTEALGMAGHSHSANIAVRKGKQDAQRAKLFSKLSGYIIIAAKNGGGDPETNLRLRYAIDKARAVSMPRDNIERAIKKGTGELAGETLDEITYEGYGPGGVAILVEATTDNRNRTNGEVRSIFEKAGGNMGTPGCVAYLFERKGLFVIDAKKFPDEDAVMTAALEAEADDFNRY